MTEPLGTETDLTAYVTSIDTDQHAQPCSLIRVYAVLKPKSLQSDITSSTEYMYVSDQMLVKMQADLGLDWLQNYYVIKSVSIWRGSLKRTKCCNYITN